MRILLLCLSLLLIGVSFGGERDKSAEEKMADATHAGEYPEAEKMLEQAQQLLRMGTRSGQKAGLFLLREIQRRYPGTPEAVEAKELESAQRPRPEYDPGKIIPIPVYPPSSRFGWDKGIEPPWIVPRLLPKHPKPWTDIQPFVL